MIAWPLIAATVLAGRMDALTPGDGDPPAIAESRADISELLNTQFESMAKSLFQSFQESDHEVLVCRKLAVDWSLLPALLVREIARGDPVESWCALLDDAYGRSVALGTCNFPLPNEVQDACARMRSQEGNLVLSYLAETHTGCVSEVPIAIHWRCAFRADQATMRTDWCEPHLALRGTNFPLPADRTQLQWDDDEMNVRVLGEPNSMVAKWPQEPPTCNFMGDAYDLFATLRAWYWAHSRGSFIKPQSNPLGNPAHKATARRLHWVRDSDRSWRLDIELRSERAIRTAGFTLASDDLPNQLSERKSAVLIRLIPEGTILSIRFCSGGAAHQAEVYSLSSMELVAPSGLLASARFTSEPRNAANSPSQMVTWPTTAWMDAMLRIRTAQESSFTPPPIPENLRGVMRIASEVRAAATANVWIHAMRGVGADLAGALGRAQELRVQDGLGHHQLAALQTLAESLWAIDAPVTSIETVLTTHRICVTELQSGEFVDACLAATSAGRFWAALDIAHHAAEQDSSSLRDRGAWEDAIGVLNECAMSPRKYIASSADPAVTDFALHMARRLIPTNFDLLPEEQMQVTAGGRAAPHAHLLVTKALTPILQPESHRVALIGSAQSPQE